VKPPLERGSGILLGASSLPSEFAIGDFGPWAFEFIELLSSVGQSYWQLLPLTPPSSSNSPYDSSSAFAGNTLFLSPELLAQERLISPSLCDAARRPSTPRADYGEAKSVKREMVRRACDGFSTWRPPDRTEFETFCARSDAWLDDYCLYKALREESGQPWYLWGSDVRDRKEATLREKKESLKELCDRERVAQFLFFEQWSSLKREGQSKGVKMVGDLPIYVNHDSADVWTHPEIFKLDGGGMPKFVAGVPPDYFSATGQLWGNPVYDWTALEDTGFKWWLQRIGHSLELFDLLRLDHFRGYVAYWEVPRGSPDAKEGLWINTPSKTFFEALKDAFPDMPFIAEDLGVITPDVVDVRRKMEIPGTRVLLFAFDETPDNPHLPSNYSKDCVAYTGTHDTNTVRGWFEEEASIGQKERLFKYAGKELAAKEVSREFVRMVLASPASLGITPAQDVLSLGSGSRMNYPGRSFGNWEWRMTPEQMRSSAFAELGEMTERCGRG
jgi:4-alpha-glucanotransferase